VGGEAPGATSQDPATAALPVEAKAGEPVISGAVVKVAIVGEIPFAGSRVVWALLHRGLAARVLCPDEKAEQTALDAAAAHPGAPGGVEVVRGDLGSPAALAQVLEGAGGACFVSPITLAGRMYRPASHPQDVTRFVEAALAAGVQKLVYHSALGAHAKAVSRTLREAAMAEDTVKTAKCKTYVARTAPLMGPGDRFLTEIVGTALKPMPFACVLGYGSTAVQPLHVYDMARCFARFYDDRPEALQPGRYSLAGPETTTLLDLLDAVSARVGHGKLKFHAPLFVLELLGALRKGSESAERVNLLFDTFQAEHNDAVRLLGEGGTLATIEQAQRDILSATAGA